MKSEAAHHVVSRVEPLPNSKAVRTMAFDNKAALQNDASQLRSHVPPYGFTVYKIATRIPAVIPLSRL